MEDLALRNIPPVEHVKPNQLALAYLEVKERFSLDEVPGILKCFSARPDVLWNYVPFADSLLLDPGHLTQRQRWTIATFVSAINQSEHCTDQHGHLLRQEGGDPQAVIDAAQGIGAGDFEPADVAMLDFARKVTVQAHAIEPADIDRLRGAEWSDEQIAEATLITAYMNLMNRLATAFGVPPRGLLYLC